LIGKYKEAQGSIKGLQSKVEELQEKSKPGADGDPGAVEGGADPAFGATIAALQDQLREVTRERDEAVERAAAAVAAPHRDRDGAPAFGEENGGAAAAATAAAREQLEAQEMLHQKALAEKQSQNEQLVQKVRQLFNTCRSLKEQVAEAAQRPPVDGGGAAAGAEGLQAQLDLKQSENDNLMARLRELAQRYRSLQQEQETKESGDRGGSSEPAATAELAERLAAAERQVAAGDERAAELTRRCEEAEAEHRRATGSLNEAVERLAALESGAATAAAAEGVAAAGEERSALEEELRASEEEKQEALTQLEAKTVEFNSMLHRTKELAGRYRELQAQADSSAADLSAAHLREEGLLGEKATLVQELARTAAADEAAATAAAADNEETRGQIRELTEQLAKSEGGRREEVGALREELRRAEEEIERLRGSEVALKEESEAALTATEESLAAQAEELCSLRERLSEADGARSAAAGAAAAAGAEVARFREEVEGLRAEAGEAQGRHKEEMREVEEKLAAAQAQVTAANETAEETSATLAAEREALANERNAARSRQEEAQAEIGRLEAQLESAEKGESEH
ncbi:unnamed protein product, partial [Hapterophycus canaliculatus]